MAISVFNEFFSGELLGNLYSENKFIDLFADKSGKVIGGKVLNMPYSSTKIGVTKNGYNDNTAASVTAISDQSLTLALNSYRTAPVKGEKVLEDWTAYGVLSESVKKSYEDLNEYVANDCLFTIFGLIDSDKVVLTSGAAGTDNGFDGTSDFNTMSYKDVIAVAKMMDDQKVKGSERYMLLPPQLYYELLADSNVIEAQKYGSANLPSGVIAEVSGINIMKRSEVGVSGTDGVAISFNDDTSAGVHYEGLAFQKDCVVRSKGDITTFETSNDPTHYGDIFSSEVYFGVTIPRPADDRVGVIKIRQA